MEKQGTIIMAVSAAILVMSFFLDSFITGMEAMLSIESAVLDVLTGLPFLGFLLILLSLYFWRQKKVVLALWTSPAAAAVSSIALKLIIARPRLFIEKFYPFGIPNYSFPSSHAAVAFAVLPVLISRKSSIGWAWLAYAVLIAASRIMLKQHYLSDVIGGALLGYGVGMIAAYILRNSMER